MVEGAHEGGSWALTHFDRPWTLNVERQGKHWAERATKVKEWRHAFCFLAKQAKVPLLSFVTVDVRQTVPNRRSMPDTVACVGAYKAALDGVVDAKVLPHDGPEHVGSVTFFPPLVGERDALTLVLHGTLAA